MSFSLAIDLQFRRISSCRFAIAYSALAICERYSRSCVRLESSPLGWDNLLLPFTLLSWAAASRRHRSTLESLSALRSSFSSQYPVGCFLPAKHTVCFYSCCACLWYSGPGTSHTLWMVFLPTDASAWLQRHPCDSVWSDLHLLRVAGKLAAIAHFFSRILLVSASFS